MANEEQLKILLQGVAAWNMWRKANPKERVNLEKADLRGMNFGWVDFSNAYLRKANLSKANLGWANLSGAILDKADLGWANLHGAAINGIPWQCRSQRDKS